MDPSIRLLAGRLAQLQPSARLLGNMAKRERKKKLHIYILDVNWGACVPVKGTVRVWVEIKKREKKTPENPKAVGRRCIKCYIHKMPIFSQGKAACQ